MVEEFVNVDELLYDVSKLEGVEKVVILLLSFFEEDVVQILKYLEFK